MDTSDFANFMLIQVCIYWGYLWKVVFFGEGICQIIWDRSPFENHSLASNWRVAFAVRSTRGVHVSRSKGTSCCPSEHGLHSCQHVGSSPFLTSLLLPNIFRVFSHSRDGNGIWYLTVTLIKKKNSKKILKLHIKKERKKWHLTVSACSSQYAGNFTKHRDFTKHSSGLFVWHLAVSRGCSLPPG